ncbi:hypothetical protein [Dysgonomonas sp. 25]|uniref:hypothetical protein n=1 Tax=Dysgonomonas sp. 25 TaxID=2302933 RepID=UPI0013D152E1|nr:hypothetical protein [Dysgonomonas sp. 25]
MNGQKGVGTGQPVRYIRSVFEGSHCIIPHENVIPSGYEGARCDLSVGGNKHCPVYMDSRAHTQVRPYMGSIVDRRE